MRPRPQPLTAFANPSLTLVPTPVRCTPLAMWHLLSLDAPTVATLWTVFIARCSGVALPWTSAAAMFVAVWMIYVADRLLDARAIELRSSNHALEERHRFHHRHRRGFYMTMSLAAAALACVLTRLAPAALELYASLATLLGLWMLVIHARPASETRRLPKEIVVGILFPAAIFIPTVARAPSLRLELLVPALLFACVCTLNCLYLYAWEHPSKLSRAQAHWTTAAALRSLPRLSVAVLLASAAASLTHTAAVAMPSLACSLSVFLLLILDRRRAHIATLHLRALADLVLLTPLLLPWVAR